MSPKRPLEGADGPWPLPDGDRDPAGTVTRSQHWAHGAGQHLCSSPQHVQNFSSGPTTDGLGSSPSERAADGLTPPCVWLNRFVHTGICTAQTQPLPAALHLRSCLCCHTTANTKRNPGFPGNWCTAPPSIILRCPAWPRGWATSYTHMHVGITTSSEIPPPNPSTWNEAKETPTMVVFPSPISLPIPSESGAFNPVSLPVPPCSPPWGVMDACPQESDRHHQAIALTAKHRLLRDTAQGRTRLCL